MMKTTMGRKSGVGRLSLTPASQLKRDRITRQIPLVVMLLPGLALLIIFQYVPMAGIVLAFQRYIPGRGLFGSTEWIGLENYEYVFTLPHTMRVIGNTIVIASSKIVFGLAVPILFSLLLNEIRRTGIKRTMQTIIYLPHFLSWVILGGILIDILSPNTGIVNAFLERIFGIEPIFFLGSNSWFQPTMVVSHVWKEFGFGTIIYLAAISGIDPQLYEAATIDGAGRIQKMIHVTLPGMLMTIVLLAVLSLGQVLSAGFEQIFNLYSPIVYRSGDIIDTFVYRIGLLQGQFSVATAIGLFQSFVSFLLISLSYFFAYRFAGYRIF